MKTVVSRCRAMLAIILYLSYMLVVAAPLLAWLRLRYAIAKTSSSKRRTAFSRLKIWIASISFRILRPVLGIQANFDCIERHATGGYLVLANHRGSFDIPIVAEFLRRNGLNDARWVVKSQLKDTPLIGTLCRESGCAFVTRTGSPEDLQAIERAGHWAEEDGASVIIFPEGTTFDVARRRPGYTNVLPPKSGGVAKLRTTMSAGRVLIVAIGWTGVGDGQEIWGAGEYVGKTLQVRARLLSHAEAPPHDVRDWLEREWRALDASL